MIDAGMVAKEDSGHLTITWQDTALASNEELQSVQELRPYANQWYRSEMDWGTSDTHFHWKFLKPNISSMDLVI